MKKLIILFAVIVLVSGCKILPDRPSKVPEVYTGTDALTMAFMENAPPEKVVTNSEISLSLLIRNKGALGVENAVYAGGKTVRGLMELSLNDAYFTIAKPKVYFDELGTEMYFLLGRESLSAGESMAVEFNAAVKSLLKEDYRQNPTTTLLATACYPYKTIASTPVCIDQNPYSTAKKGCTMGNVKLSGGQGAPVAVTRVEQGFAFNNSRLIPRFNIFVENLGKGDVVDVGSVESACGAQEAEYNIVRLEEASLSGNPLVCERQELSLERPDESFFTCTYLTGFEKADSSFYTALKAVLSYGYVIKESKTVEIEVVNLPKP